MPKLTKEERSKVAKRSKETGGTFERKVAKAFTAAFKGTVHEFEYHKVPRSGGLRWGNMQNTIGDIVTPLDFRYTIECKKHSDIDYEVLFLDREANKVADLISFWKQTWNEALRAMREPMLVFEKKRGLSIVMLLVSSYRATIFPEERGHSCIFAMVKNPVNNWDKVVLLPLTKYCEIMVHDKMFVQKGNV